MELTCAIPREYKAVTSDHPQQAAVYGLVMLQSSTDLRKGRKKGEVKRIVNQLTIAGDQTVQ